MKAMTDVERSLGLVKEDQIRQRAYEIFLTRGAIPGQDVEDWLRAESELLHNEGEALGRLRLGALDSVGSGQCDWDEV